MVGLTAAPDLDAVADELYGLPPGSFTAARTARAAEARRAGQRDVARAIAQLRRPTGAAALVNQLVRRRADDVGELLRLGDTLRAAAGPLTPAEVRELGKERREVVGRLVGAAGEIGAELGLPTSDSTMRDVEATLTAGFSDAEAGAALRAGRLTAPLHYSGLGGLGGSLSGAGSPVVAAAEEDSEPAAPSAVASRDAPSAAAAAAATVRRDAEELLRHAETAAATADEVAEARADEMAEAGRRGDDVAARIAALEAELANLREEARAAADLVRGAEAAHAAADAERQAAHRHVDAARRILDALPEMGD